MKLAVIFPVVAPPFAAKSAAKPFVKVDNREIFLRTVELYAPRERIEQRIVVVPPDDLGTIQQKFAAHLGFQGVSVAGGGADWFSCVARAARRCRLRCWMRWRRRLRRPRVSRGSCP